MSEFEFLRGLPFGPYLAVDSPLHRLDPRARILMVVLLMAGLTAASHPLGLLIGLGVVLSGWPLGRAPFAPLLRGWLAVLPFLVILAIIQVVFRAGEEGRVLFSVGKLVISMGDVWAGVALLLRFSAYIALLGLAAASLSESEITHGLEALLRPLSHLRIPVQDFITVVQVTLRFFPLLAQSAERIAKAQAARGADWQPAGWNLAKRVRQIAPLIVPLFVTSLRRAENMALAMDARGYGSLPVRSSMVTLRYRIQDGLAIATAVGVAAGMIIL